MQTDTTRRLRAMLFIDVVDSVRLTHDDQQGTIDRWRKLMAAVATEDLPKWRGRRVKLQGDGMLSEFESTVGAIECAIAIRSRVARSEQDVEPFRRVSHRQMRVETPGQALALTTHMAGYNSPGMIESV
jgi:class 3 adenylate cyclase